MALLVPDRGLTRARVDHHDDDENFLLTDQLIIYYHIRWLDNPSRPRTSGRRSCQSRVTWSEHRLLGVPYIASRLDAIVTATWELYVWCSECVALLTTCSEHAGGRTDGEMKSLDRRDFHEKQYANHGLRDTSQIYKAIRWPSLIRPAPPAPLKLGPTTVCWNGKSIIF